jgi:regulator of sirC expression with transglutaminase-like and TPR domain
MNSPEPDAQLDALNAYGRMPDADIDIGAAALQLASVQHPGLLLERYQIHMRKLAEDVAARHRELEELGASDTLDSRITALRDVLAGANGYNGDADGRDALQSADLVAVIDRRLGAAPALVILYLHAARAQGWEAHGLLLPGTALVRMDYEGERVICDPFTGFSVLQASDLRRMVKRALGPKAELSATYYEPAENRALLVRLQNIIKTRQIEAEDYEGALQTVTAMRAVDPGEYRLLLDQGVLCARLDMVEVAIVALESYIEKAPQNRDRHEAATLLQQLKQTLG